MNSTINIWKGRKKRIVLVKKDMDVSDKNKKSPAEYSARDFCVL